MNDSSSRKSVKEKSCSLPIIYLLLLFLSSICIKYLNWEIPNVHNLQQASNPGKIISKKNSQKSRAWNFLCVYGNFRQR